MKIYHHYLTKLLIPLLVSSFFFVSSCEEDQDPECIESQQDLITALTAFNSDTSAVSCEAVKVAALAYVAKSCSDTIPGFEDFTPDALASLDCASIEQEVTLITATFHEEFDPLVKSFIFITDNDGTVLADTIFNNLGDDSFVLKKNFNFFEVPKRINVTTGTSDDGEIEMSTNNSVEVGGNVHFYNPYIGAPSTTIGSSYYKMTQLPCGGPDNEINRFYIGTKGLPSYEYSSDNYTGEYEATLEHYYDNEDVLITVYCDDGSGYYVNIEDVQIGDTTVFNFDSMMNTTQSVDIPNNTGTPYAYHSHYGYEANGSYIWFNRLAKLKRSTSLDYNNDNFVISYAPSVTPRVEFQAYAGEGNYQEPGAKHYSQETVGELPSSVEKIDADIVSIVNSDLNNFEIITTGTYDQWSLSIEDEVNGLEWDFYNSSDSMKMSIPNIPESIINEYPVLANPSFSIDVISLTDWGCADSYDGWYNLYFSTNGYYKDFCSSLRRLVHWPPE